MSKIILISVTGFLLVLLLNGCDSTNKPAPVKNVRIQITSNNELNYFDIINKDIQMTVTEDPVVSSALLISYPKGGETFYFGDTVTISFGVTGASGSTLKWAIGKEAYTANYRLLYQDTMFGSSANPNPCWKCKLKVYLSENNNIHVKSAEFTIKYTTPYFLRYPNGGEVYKITDTMPIIYTFRDDSMSVIQTHYWSIAKKKWSQIITFPRIPAQDDWHLVTAKRNFIPTDTINNLDAIGDSTRIMIVDYSTGSKQIESGWIKLTR